MDTRPESRFKPDILRALYDALPSLVEKVPHVVQGVLRETGEYEWYTPAIWADMAREAMGGIDLDPASSAKANELVRATKYITKHDDPNGLEAGWSGRVYCNPPYFMPAVQQFAEKLAGHYSAGNIEAGIFLVHNATDAAWWQDLAAVADAILFSKGRINFIRGSTMQTEEGSSIRGQTVFYLGPNVPRFVSAFEGFGIALARP